MRMLPSTFHWLLFLASWCSSHSTTAEPVTLTVWTTPNGDWHSNLLENTKEVVSSLSQDVVFEPNQYIHNGGNVCRPEGTALDEDRRQECEKNCLYEGRYCQVPGGDDDPKYSSLVGAPMVVESARRQCIWNIADSQQKFWDYLESLEATQCNVQLTDACLETVYAQIGLKRDSVEACMYNGTSPDEDVDNVLLQHQIDLATQTPVTDIPQVLVNGKALETADLTTETIFQAVCDAYEKDTEPKLCGLCNSAPALCGSCWKQCPSSIEECLRNSACPAGLRAEETPPDENVDEAEDGQEEDLEDLLLKNPESTESKILQVEEEQVNETIDTMAPHDNHSGFAKLTHLLAKQDIYVYQMLKNCGVDFRRKGPLVSAIEVGDQHAFASGAGVCSVEEADQFTGACDGFERCAGFDFLEFAESNAAALGNSFFGCLNAFATIPDNEVVIEQCTALVLNTGLWRPVGYFLEYSAMICPCIPELQSNLPGCVFERDESPAALDGPVVQLSTCLLGQLCERITPLCQTEVANLNDCLPSIHEKDKPCEEIEEKCKSKGAFLFTAPFPLAGATFPDQCQSLAKNAKVINRYNSYRTRCVVKDESIREFGSPDEAEGNDEGDNIESSSSHSKSLYDSWKDMPWHTRLLSGGVACLAIAFATALLYALRSGRRYRSQIQLGDLANEEDALCVIQEPYRDNVEE